MQSLGFCFLNVDSTLFLWDQILLKVEANELEMHYAFITLLVCCREELMLIESWTDFAEMIYMKGKATSIDNFIAKYREITEEYISLSQCALL